MSYVGVQLDRWHEVKGDASRELFSQFETVRAQNQLRIELNRFYLSLYYDRAYAGYNSGDLAGLLIDGMQGRLNENVIQRICSALCAKFARQKPKPTVLTDGADWALQQRAKKYDKYIWATLHASKFPELQRLSDLWMLGTGTGAIGVHSRGGQVRLEHIPSSELFVNTASARYGTPQELFRRQLVDRRLLKRRHPKLVDAIMSAQCVSTDDAFSETGMADADLIPVVTGWRLPSEPGADDGRVVVAIEGAELDSAEWCRPRFPIAFSRYMLAPEGFWGVGLIQSLVGLQLELNRVNAAKQDAFMRLGVPYVLLETGSKVVKSHLSNELGRIIEYQGTPPQVVAPGVIHPEVFQHGDRVKSGAFQQSGLSEMAAQGFKPAGVNSGVALRAYSDMVDDNYHDCLLRREQQALDLAEIILDEAEELAESGESPKCAVYVGPFGTETISFDDAHIDRDSLVLKVQPTSSLATTLSGRLEDLMDLRELGVVTDPAEMQELLQLPDLETAASRRNSMRDLLLQTIEVTILEQGTAVTPEPSWDLKTALKLCIQTRLRAQLRGAPQDRIDLLRTFEEKCIYYISQANTGAGSGQPQPTTQPSQPVDAMDAEVPPEMAIAPDATAQTGGIDPSLAGPMPAAV